MPETTYEDMVVIMIMIVWLFVWCQTTVDLDHAEERRHLGGDIMSSSLEVRGRTVHAGFPWPQDAWVYSNMALCCFRRLAYTIKCSELPTRWAAMHKNR